MNQKDLLESFALLSCLEGLSSSLTRFQIDLMVLGHKKTNANSHEILRAASERFRDDLVVISSSLKDACFEIETIGTLKREANKRSH